MGAAWGSRGTGVDGVGELSHFSGGENAPFSIATKKTPALCRAADRPPCLNACPMPSQRREGFPNDPSTTPPPLHAVSAFRRRWCWPWRSRIATWAAARRPSCSTGPNGGCETRSESGETWSPCLSGYARDACARPRPGRVSRVLPRGFCRGWGPAHLLDQHVEVLGDIRSEACNITLSVRDQAEAYYFLAARCVPRERTVEGGLGGGVALSARTVRLEDSQDLVAFDGRQYQTSTPRGLQKQHTSHDSDLGDTVRVSEDDADLRGRRALLRELADLLDDLVGRGLEPSRRVARVRNRRGRNTLSRAVKTTHDCGGGEVFAWLSR